MAVHDAKVREGELGLDVAAALDRNELVVGSVDDLHGDAGGLDGVEVAVLQAGPSADDVVHGVPRRVVRVHRQVPHPEMERPVSREELEEPLPEEVVLAQDEAHRPADVLVPGHDGGAEQQWRPELLLGEPGQRHLAGRRLLARREVGLP